MEPTIYKPSIYKGAGIYKTGLEGGGGVDDDYETDFSNFDFIQKIDIPNKGFITFYDDRFTYSYDGGLKITTTGNIENQRYLGFYSKNGSICEVEFEFICSSANFAFLWITESITISCSPNDTTKLFFMVGENYIPSTINIPYIKTAYGYKYYDTGILNSGNHIVKVEYLENEFSIYIDSSFIATYPKNTDFCQINASPRNGAYVVLKRIKF